jgi:hypothetical protein
MSENVLVALPIDKVNDPYKTADPDESSGLGWMRQVRDVRSMLSLDSNSALAVRSWNGVSYRTQTDALPRDGNRSILLPLPSTSRNSHVNARPDVTTDPPHMALLFVLATTTDVGKL